METYIRLFRRIQPWLNRQYNLMGISGIQASIILSLTTGKVKEQHELVNALGLRKGTISKAVEQLVDIRTIKADPNLSPMDRWYSYLRQVKNPYCVKVGNFGVKLTFPDEP
ncbi:MAG: MarR family transcriptional regulator [Oscillospiraceae bacterium]|nr:MarR family transcriptional regulator [Oscillospiraceae bacterium]